MPISVTCSCTVKLRVPDTATGKAVKCPKCGAVIKVPAVAPANGEAAPVAPPAAVTAKPAAVKAAAPSAVTAASAPPAEDNDLDILEEVKGPPTPGRVKPAGASPTQECEIPEHLREKVEPVLETGEKVVWIGQASPTVAFRRGTWMWLFAIILLAMTVGVTAYLIRGPLQMTRNMRGAESPLALVALVFPVILLGMTACFVAGPFFKKWAAKRSCYVVTNRRCLVWYGTPFSNSEVYLPGQVGNLRTRQAWFCGDDAGDVVFRSVTTITTTYSRRRHSGRIDASTSQTTRYYGFLDIENVSEVEDIIRKNLVSRWQRKIKKLASLDDDDQ